MDRFLNWFLTLKDVYPRQHCTSQSRKAAGEKSKKLTQGQLVKSMQHTILVICVCVTSSPVE
jgi:hypothetical protein